MTERRSSSPARVLSKVVDEGECVDDDPRDRRPLVPSHRLAPSVARLLGPNTLPGALGQPRQLYPALPEGGSDRAAARNHAVLDAAAAALPPRQHLGRDPGARGPDGA